MPKISKKNKIKKIKKLIFSIFLLILLFLSTSYYFYQKGIEHALINDYKDSILEHKDNENKDNNSENIDKDEAFDVSFEENKKSKSHSQIKMTVSNPSFLKRIWILTCESNLSDKYDDKYYYLDNLATTKNDFYFNIDKSYNNYCDIPYKVVFETEKGDYDHYFSLPSVSKYILKKDIEKILKYYNLSSLDFSYEIAEKSSILRLDIPKEKCGLFGDILRDPNACSSENAFIMQKLAYSLYNVSFLNLDDKKVKSSALFSLSKNKQIIDIYSKNSPYNNYLNYRQIWNLVSFPDFIYNLDKNDVTSIWRPLNADLSHFISFSWWNLIIEDIISWQAFSLTWIPKEDMSTYISREDKSVAVLSKKPDANWYYTVYYGKLIWWSAVMKSYKVWAIDCSDSSANIPPNYIKSILSIADKKIQTSWFCPVWIESSIFDLETLSLES